MLKTKAGSSWRFWNQWTQSLLFPKREDTLPACDCFPYLDGTYAVPTAYSYTRFSSIGQRKGTSEARQAEGPGPWCKEHGCTLDTSLRLKDLGRSGYHGDH